MNWAAHAHVLGWSIIHYLWVGTLLGGALWLLRRGFDGVRPEIRHALALFNLTAMLFGMAGTFAVVSRTLSEAQAQHSMNFASWSQADLVLLANALDSPSTPTAAAATPLPFLLLAGFWAAGATALLLRFSFGWRASCSIAQSARPLREGPWVASLPTLLSEMQIVRRVRIASSEALRSPAVFGVLRPTIIVPTALLLSWTPLQVEMALLHELAHIKRHDNVIRMVQRIIESLVFFHPMTWLLSADLSRDREDCCDAVVLRHRHDRRLYARTLYSLAGPPVRGSLSLSSMADRALLPRVRRILEKDASMISPRQRVVHLAVAVVLVFALILTVDAQVNPAQEREGPVEAKDSPEPPTESVRVLRLGLVTEETEAQEEPTSAEIKKLARALREAMGRIDKLERELGEIRGAGSSRDPRAAGPQAPRDPRPAGPKAPRAPRAPQAPDGRKSDPFEHAHDLNDAERAMVVREANRMAEAKVLRAREQAHRAAEVEEKAAHDKAASAAAWFDRGTRKKLDAAEKLKIQLAKLEALESEAHAARLAAEEMRAQVELLKRDIGSAEPSGPASDGRAQEEHAKAAAIRAHLEAARAELLSNERTLRYAQDAIRGTRLRSEVGRPESPSKIDPQQEQKEIEAHRKRMEHDRILQMQVDEIRAKEQELRIRLERLKAGKPDSTPSSGK